jgi:PAS domain S-box-containing protein
MHFAERARATYDERLPDSPTMNPSRRRPPPGREPADDAFRLLIAGIKDYAIFLLDPDGRVASWNAGAESINGYTADEIIGSHFSRFYPPEALARDWPKQELQLAAEAGRCEEEAWRVRKDGSQFWASVIITALWDEKGRLRGFAKVVRDLTERKRQEDALRASEERFRSLVEGVRDYSIFMLSTQGIVLSWNAGARAMKGYEAHEIIGSHFSRFYTTDAIQRHWPDQELKIATMEGRVEDEGWRVRKDGSRFWANIIITALRDGHGELIGFSKITRDLTERRQAEELVRQSEERLRLLIEGVDEYAVFMLDANGLISSWNTGAERMSGYKAGEIVGRHYSHFYRPEDIVASKPWQELATARQTGRLTEEGWRLRKNGAAFWANSNVTAMHDTQGDLYGFACITQDLTLRRQTAALEDAARRMHEFVAMLAHELRNPLAPIRNAVALMGKKGLSDPTLEAMRQTIDRQSAHLGRILDELLDVNRVARGKFTIERSPIELGDILVRAIETSRPLIESRGQILRTEVPAHPVNFSGDALRLTQAIVNLLNNAARYTREGGEISLTVTADEQEIKILVRDNGRGIAPEMLERIFDLFMQLQPQENGAHGGLGVGLALVRRIVQLHGGTVVAHSAGLGAGSEFLVRLPLVSKPRPAIAPSSAGEASAAEARPDGAKRLRILVVDDNADAADSLALLLQALGQETRTVYDGTAALAAVESFRPQVVLLDLGMPKMDGYQVARRISSEPGGVRPLLVAITGWGQDADKQRSREAGFHHHFVKPVGEQTLRRLLEEVAVIRAAPE